MGSCCSSKKKEKEKLKKSKEDDQGKSGDQNDVRFKLDNESPPSDQRLMSEQKLREEQEKAFKAGESSYAKVKEMHQKTLNRTKSISGSQYNQKGLIDEKSKEFQIVRTFLDGKGYELVTSIGSGSYAEVYKALRRKPQKPVAVKVIDLRKANENYRENFLQSEINILSNCKHPNIIKMYEIAQTKKRIFMIMEFAPNGTLTDWLKEKGAFTEITAHMMFVQILEALYFMHTRRIAHRDLKLENILLTQNHNPKISDFSYAVRYGPKDPKSTTYCGSLPYFSPELLMRQPYDPLVSDIWSLGICFYIMLNDALPFRMGDDRVMLKKQLTKDWKFRDKVEHKLSAPLKSMIKKMLEPDVGLRISTSQLMQEPWIKNK